MFWFIGQTGQDERPPVATVDVGALPFLIEQYSALEDEVLEAQMFESQGYDALQDAITEEQSARKRYLEENTPENLEFLNEVVRIRKGMEETVAEYGRIVDAKIEQLLRLKNRIESIQKIVDSEQPPPSSESGAPIVIGAGTLLALLLLG